MPDVPWTPAEWEPGEYVVMASHLPLRSISSTLRFFRAVAAIRKQLSSTEGLVGYTLRAKPLARDYWTLSAWHDRVALEQFMRTPPHVRLMGSLKPFMGTTRFVQWEITGADGRPSWTDAFERLTPAELTGP
jgi:quinol monooxygenase YgiN